MLQFLVYLLFLTTALYGEGSPSYSLPPSKSYTQVPPPARGSNPSQEDEGDEDSDDDEDEIYVEDEDDDNEYNPDDSDM